MVPLPVVLEPLAPVEPPPVVEPLPLPEPLPVPDPLMLPEVVSEPEVPEVLPVEPLPLCEPEAEPLVEPAPAEPLEELSVSVLPPFVPPWPQPVKPSARARNAEAAVIFSDFVFMFFPKVLIFFAGRPAD